MVLTIGDLASRWSVSVPEAIEAVREGSVPYFRIKSSDLRVCWSKVRFRKESIERWEVENQQTHMSSRSIPRNRNRVVRDGGRLGIW